MAEDERSDWIGRIAERKIVEAIEAGEFDNLPGRGKPLVLDDDTTVPAHMRAGNRILRNAGVVPDWIAVEQEIEQARQAADCHCAKWLPMRGKVTTAQLTAARTRYERLMRDVNDLILRHNLAFSFIHRSPIPIRIKDRLAEWDEGVPS